MEENGFRMPTKELLYSWLCRLADRLDMGVAILDAANLTV